MHKDAQVIVDYCRSNATRGEMFTAETVGEQIETLERQIADPRFKHKVKQYKTELAKAQLVLAFFQTGKAGE